ncbi:methionyl-tRNA formyltransferase [Microbacterium terrae]|uniref:Methionyl-tRNA formyltransferase n=1 Tax=Microbacterium terrae TaxID=69369 RepID=A0A0M2H2W8_9MICO|nr:methionyl-tRNA formyltransferase [Microbacterium terrae]KJL37986.1 Methionyl-tRNA formyltransferase [Microbacterium terrae]MBP1077395.1 methionyl-tRNA formyltransferase [Microbacterium terrae]GLJ99005.1 methionyl-tRNA formyltransferase [Microbacterium terrae]
MRLVFAGTPDPAVPSLRRLAASGHEIVAVVTRRDAPLGRKRVMTPSPVATAAGELGLRVIRADRLDDAVTGEIAALQPDLGVIVAYGGLVREPLLTTPAHGWINLHFSLLPRWRGAAPVQHALIAGDGETGASVFQLVAGLDAGDVFAERAHTIPADATAGDLLAALADDGADLLADVVDAIAAGTATARPQVGDSTYAGKLGDEDGRIRWNEPASAVLGRIRGVTPEPGAHTTIDGARLKVHTVGRAPDDAPALAPGALTLHDKAVIVGTATDPIRLDSVQPAGKAPMRAADWVRGLRAAEPVLGA